MSDLILYNANIHTQDNLHPRVQAIAIRDNRILAIGTDDQMRAVLPHAEAIDLGGRCVIPGLIDAHVHAEWIALGLKNIDAETPTLADLLQRVSNRVAITPKNQWIRGHGWNQNVWGGTFPTKADLDRVAPEHPVYLTAKSGHAGWANSIGLKLAGITGNTPNPANGEIVRDEHGEPTGVFFEDAMDLISHIIPQESAHIVADAMRNMLPLMHRAGLTGVHDFDGARALQAWQILKERGE